MGRNRPREDFKEEKEGVRGRVLEVRRFLVSTEDLRRDSRKLHPLFLDAFTTVRSIFIGVDNFPLLHHSLCPSHPHLHDGRSRDGRKTFSVGRGLSRRVSLRDWGGRWRLGALGKPTAGTDGSLIDRVRTHLQSNEKLEQGNYV